MTFFSRLLCFCLSFLSDIWYITYTCMALFFTKNLYFRTRNSFMTPFLTQFVLSHASDNTTSRNIGGTDAWGVPHLTFLGDRPPVLPKSLPMLLTMKNYIAPFKGYYSGPLQSSSWKKFMWTWNESEWTLGNKRSVKRSPILIEEPTTKESSAKRGHGQMRTPADGGR